MNLYFETCLPFLKKPFVNLACLHCHPYSWLESSNQPVAARNGRARAHWHFNLLLFVAYFVFVTYRASEAWLDSAESHDKKLYMVFVWLLCVYSGNVHLAVWRTAQSFIPFIRGYVTFLQAGESFLAHAGFTTYNALPYKPLLLATGVFCKPLQKVSRMTRLILTFPQMLKHARS